MTNAAISRDFWKPDAVIWGDGRPAAQEPSKAHPPHGFMCDYRIDVPATGWYELFLLGARGDLRHDVVLDGKPVYDYRTTDKDDKAGNLWLTAGAHTLRIQRLGRVSFPMRVFERFELRAAAGRAEACVTAEKTLVDVMRVGEPFRIRVTGGGSGTVQKYELLNRDLQDAEDATDVVGAVEFTASDVPVTQEIVIPCPRDGAFALSARVAGGRVLSASEFPIGQYAVVDTRNVPMGSGALEPVHVIDCIAQTDNGQPLPADTFVECNGPTRITESKAGRYRESHDCTPPQAETPASPTEEPRGYSGFSYRLELPEVQVPYLIEVQFPDDARRSVTVNLSWLDPKTGGFGKEAGYNGKSYETGGIFPLSNEMRDHRAVVWPESKTVLLGILGQQNGHRAAAARIRISRFKDGILPGPVNSGTVPGGRAVMHWYEEGNNWRFLVNVAGAYAPGLVHDVVGLDRWAQLVRYNGMNGISAMGVAYQGAFWRTKALLGYGPEEYDSCRLLTLICEKYGLKYMPEVFPAQWYMSLITLPQRAQNPDDVRSVNCLGGRQGNGAAACNLNPLHPVVQQLWLDAIGELADNLRDSPAFAGVSVRADVWLFRGDFTYPSLNWGYGDWTIREFEKDTGIKVAGGPNDPAAPAEGNPQRYLDRYNFLTAAGMRERWISWRCDRISDYHQRLRDRIRGDRKDLYFAIVGDFRCDPLFGQPDDIGPRARETGVDLDRLAKLDGLAVMPYSRYGARYTTAAEQEIYDGFFRTDNVHAGMGNPRAFSGYMTYHELGTAWPADKLGINVPQKGKVPYYCSAVLPAGRNSLEKFAVVLAEQDTALLRDGGNTDIYGDPDLWRAWFAEFKALPAVPFTPLPAATDPVAVWYGKDTGLRTLDTGKTASSPSTLDPRPLASDPRPSTLGTFLFYAVNRERYPVTCTLTVQGATAVTRLVGGETVALKDGKLALTLAPFELRAFRADAGATLTAATTAVPAEQIDFVRRRLAFAQALLDTIPTGTQAGPVTAAERAAFATGLAEAWNAYQASHFWRARVALSMAPMMRVYEKLAAMPEGQVVTRFPNLLQPQEKAGHWNLTEPMLTAEELARLVPAGSAASLTPSTEFNPEWGGKQVLVTGGNELVLNLDIPADGAYTFKLGHVAKTGGVIVAELAGQSLAVPAVTVKPGTPEATVFPPIQLKAGKARLALRRPGGFGVYGLKLLPGLRPMPDAIWSVVGPFPSPWGQNEDHSGKQVKAGMETVYPPELDQNVAAVYKADAGRELRWTQKTGTIVSSIDDKGVNMAIRTCSPAASINFALTFITAESERTALLFVPVDWWARAYLNGERLRTEMDPKVLEDSGADFTTHYPRYSAVLKLKKGTNTLLIKQQGGSLGSAFAAYITDAADITLAPTPGK